MGMAWRVNSLSIRKRKGSPLARQEIPISHRSFVR
jgi:hypothetical protein